MIYATASIWLVVVVLLAWAVHHVWSGITKPKTVNAVLLPGTLIAQLGRILGLLVTGATVNHTALMKDDDSGGPATDADPQPKLPIIGPVLVALLPMVALGALIYLAIAKLGMPVVVKVPQDLIATELPGTLAAFWGQLRGLITLAEGTLNAVQTAETPQWRVILFAYLMICLTVRMAPLPGNFRGHLGAIVTLGVIAWIVGSISAQMPGIIERAWPLLSLTVGWLLLLLMITLVVRGVLTSVRMVLNLDD